MVVKSRHHQTNGATGARFGWEHAPHSPSQSDLEIGVVGCLIENPSAIPEALSVGLEAGDFMDPELQTLFCCVVAMHAEGRHVDAETVAHDLIYFELVKDGDTAKLVKLRDGVVHAREYGCFPSKVKEYAKCLVDASVRRSLHNFAGRLAKDNQQWKYSDLSALITEYRQRLDNIASRLDGQQEQLLDQYVIRAHQVQPQNIEWLWQGWIPYRAISILDGDPSLGKSQIECDLAARVSRGWLPPPRGGPGNEPGGVLILNAEDDIERTIVPRLIEAGADLSKVAIWNEERGIKFPQGLGLLDQLARKANARLIIIDPIAAYLDCKTDMHRDQDVRSVLRQLKAVAESTGAAILLIRHLNKQDGGPALYRGTGSIGLVGAARSAMIVGKHPSDDFVRVLGLTKCNLAEKSKPLSYRIISSGTVSRIEWIGEADVDVQDIVVFRRRTEARKDAKAFLKQVLRNGPVMQEIIEQRASQEGISLPTLRRAKQDLGVFSLRDHANRGKWYWRLPPDDANET